MTNITTVGGLEMFAIGLGGKSGIDTDPATLSRCPMCGHEAGYYSEDRAAMKHPFGVTCTNTSCAIATPKHYVTREDAAKAWNRRAADSASADTKA